MSEPLLIDYDPDWGVSVSDSTAVSKTASDGSSPSSLAPVPGGEIDFQNTDPDTLQYSWVNDKEYHISFTEKIVVDAYLVRFMIQDCIKSLRERVNIEARAAQINQMLNRPHVLECLRDRFKKKGIFEGLTLEEYVALGKEALVGKVKWNPEQVQIFKQLARVKGFEAAQGAGASTNIQINFLQKNGEE